MSGDSARVDASHPVSKLTIGDGSVFGTNDWWSNDDWHKLSVGGFASDIVCDAGTVGEVAVAAVSIRGHKHRVDGSPNEDSFAVRVAKDVNGNEYAILVLCDGLSSAKFSSFAARRTSALVADLLQRLMSDAVFSIDRLKDTFGLCLTEFVAPELIRWPKPSGELSLPAYGCPDKECSEVSPADLLVTLTVALVPTTNGTKGASDILLASIGDSPALILTQRGEWVRPERNSTDDGVLSTATAAFPKSTDVVVTDAVLYEGDCLCLMSDGVGNFVMNKSGTLRLGTHLAEVWRNPRDLPTLIRDISFDLRSADDDRTVILCWTDRELKRPETPPETDE